MRKINGIILGTDIYLYNELIFNPKLLNRCKGDYLEFTDLNGAESLTMVLKITDTILEEDGGVILVCKLEEFI